MKCLSNHNVSKQSSESNDQSIIPSVSSHEAAIPIEITHRGLIFSHTFVGLPSSTFFTIAVEVSPSQEASSPVPLHEQKSLSSFAYTTTLSTPLLPLALRNKFDLSNKGLNFSGYVGSCHGQDLPKIIRYFPGDWLWTLEWDEDMIQKLFLHGICCMSKYNKITNYTTHTN
jgi:hypothetical protein